MLIDYIENGRKQEYILKSPAQEGSVAMSGRCMHVCVWLHEFVTSKKTLSEFLNTLFQFQKALKNKLPAPRGAGALNYKVELPGNRKRPTLLEGRLYEDGERRQSFDDHDWADLGGQRCNYR